MEMIYSDRLDAFNVPDWDEGVAFLEYYQEMQQEELSWFISNLIDNHGWLIAKGVVGRWNEKVKAIKIIKSFNDFCTVCGKNMTDSVVDVVMNDDGNIEVKVAHHDGFNFFEVRQLTKKGAEYVDDYDRECDYKSLCEAFEKYTRKRVAV